jgi:hypothetical protein
MIVENLYLICCIIIMNGKVVMLISYFLQESVVYFVEFVKFVCWNAFIFVVKKNLNEKFVKLFLL